MPGTLPLASPWACGLHRPPHGPPHIAVPTGTPLSGLRAPQWDPRPSWDPTSTPAAKILFPHARAPGIRPLPCLLGATVRPAVGVWWGCCVRRGEAAGFPPVAAAGRSCPPQQAWSPGDAACVPGAPVPSLALSPTFHQNPLLLGTSSLTLDLRELRPPGQVAVDRRGLSPHRGQRGASDPQVGCGSAAAAT